jgi:hypothetical protein
VRTLGSVGRAIVATSAFGAFAGAFAGVSLGARGAPGTAMTPQLPLPSHRPAALALVLPRRDPFAGGDASASPPPVAPVAPLPAALGPLPPNAGAGSAPFPLLAEAAQVRAVITGAQPFALVEEGGATRLVTLGDGVAGDTIAAIGTDGVRLAHGRTIAVAHAASASPSASGGFPQ